MLHAMIVTVAWFLLIAAVLWTAYAIAVVVYGAKPVRFNRRRNGRKG